MRQHTCSGLFGAMQTGRIRFDSNLYILSCRGEPGSTPKLTRTLPGEKSPGFLDRVGATAGHLLGLAAVNQADAESYFERLDSETRAMLLVYDEVKAWSYAREARRYLDVARPLGLLRYWLGQPDTVQQWLSADPVLSAALQEAWTLVDAYHSHMDEALWAALSPEDYENLRHLTASRPESRWPNLDALSHLAALRNREVLDRPAAQILSFAQIGPIVAIGEGHDHEIVFLMHDPQRRHVLKTGSLRFDHDALVARYDDPAFDSDPARTQVAEAVRQAGGERLHWD